MTTKPEVGGLPVSVPREETPSGDGSALPQLYVPESLTPEQFKARRERLLAFIQHQLTPSDVDAKGRLVRVNDYYKVPGAETYALSRKGAELLGELYRYKVAASETAHEVLTKEFVAIRARVALHRSNMLVAVREGACTTAEKQFQSERAQKKYGGDYRAAYNDVLARAQKRAYVNAMIAACAATDLFTLADELDYEEVAEAAAVPGPVPAPAAAAPPRAVADGGATPDQLWQAMTLLAHEAFTAAERRRFIAWINGPQATAAQLDEQLRAMEARIHAA